MALKTGNSMKIKMNIALAFMLIVGFGTLVVRLYMLQIAQGEFYRSKALSQQMRPTAIPAARGTIYDRNMKTLAASATVFMVTISPAEIKDEQELSKIADFLAPLLELDRDKIIQRGQKKSSYYEILKQRVEKEIADQITEFTLKENIIGVNLVENTKRYYPFGDLCSTVIGFTDNDNRGAYGIESYYNKILSGTPGMVVSAKNAISGNMPFAYDKMFAPVDGNSLVLTIDEVVQHSLEKHLETAVIEHNVKNRAVAIAMDVKTGAVLGMTTKPDFDPNEPSVLQDPDAQARLDAYLQSEEFHMQLAAISDPAEREKEEARLWQLALQDEWYAQWRNKAISDPYEPGSVFKVITSSMALDLGVVRPTGQTFYCPGYQIVAGRRKSCWKAGGHGTINFTEAVKYSCNPAFMTVGAAIGPDNFYTYFDRFGLREPTGIDLPGEAEGIFYNIKTLSKESGEELASSAFGQTFTVTPLQLITAVSAAVNGGKLMQPYVVSQVLDPGGNVVSTTEPTVRRTVMSEESSRLIADILEHVVADADGSGRYSYVPGYRIGGKTGTSEKLDAKEDGEVTKRISSFLGVSPSNDPQVAVLVMLDEPHMQNVYGSIIAAPVVGAIFSDIMPYLGVDPQYTEKELTQKEVAVPFVTGKILHDAIADLTMRGLKYKTVGEGVSVVRQLPSSSEVMPKGGTVILYTDQNQEIAQVTVPNVVGLTAQQANRTILNTKLNVKTVGEASDEGARVLSQYPAAGTLIDEGTVITISFTEHLEEADKKPEKPTPAPPQQQEGESNEAA